MMPNGYPPSVNAKDEDGPRQGARSIVLTTLWFGLLAGWLELGLVLAQGAFHPHVTMGMLRTNRHVVWMIPVSDALLFGAVGLSIALVARFRSRLAGWFAFRLPVALAFLTLLFDVEGLHPIAAISLACGLGAVIGPRLGRRAGGFGRLVRVSFPVMAVATVVLMGLTYERVTSTERRALSRAAPARPGAPNVVMIVLDTVRASCMSLHGHPRPTTPNLERLARRGIVFTEARSTAPWTSPTHASLFTGRWPHELSVAPGVPLDGTFPTLAETLGREGYATAGFVGNLYYCNALYGLDRGFARYEDAYENQTVSFSEILWSSGLGRRLIQALHYPVDLEDGVTLLRKTAAMLNRDVLGWLGGRPAGRPFFVFINYYDAHRPYKLQEDPETHFGMALLPRARQLEIENRFVDLLAGKHEPGGLSPEFITRDALDLYHDLYDSSIAYIDRQVGLLVDEIERRGLLDNTLVIVTSDHGEHLGERGLIIHGASLYRPETHVPLVVIPPSRSSAHKVVDEPVSLRDVPATVAEYVGLGQGSPFPGRSLTRFVGDGTEALTGTSPVLCELEHNIAFPDATKIPSPFGLARSLVTRDRVYIRRDDGGEELYDLVNDPMESVDLAKDPLAGPVLAGFREELARMRRGEGTTTR